MAADPLTISCDECILQASGACADCIVAFVLGHDDGEAIVIDAAEQRAVRLLQDAGLVPALRHRRRAS
jgi:hypothetical protein